MPQKVRTLHSFSANSIEEIEWIMPDQLSNQIKIQTILCGICRSDIFSYTRQELMPYSSPENPNGIPGTFGHEGLGKVIEVGSAITDVQVGDIVSTFSDPAYADYYYAKIGEYVKVPEAHPKYVLQPVASATNIFLETAKFSDFLGTKDEEILMLGSGFMAATIAKLAKQDGRNITVVGRANREIYNSMGVQTLDFSSQASYKKWHTVIDISSKVENFYLVTEKLAAEEALIAYCGTPEEDVKTNFFTSCWNAYRFIMPSPRSKGFHRAMEITRDMIISGDLEVEGLWTKGYDRADFQQGFIDGADRNPGYIRGYLRWSE